MAGHVHSHKLISGGGEEWARFGWGGAQWAPKKFFYRYITWIDFSGAALDYRVHFYKNFLTGIFTWG